MEKSIERHFLPTSSRQYLQLASTNIALHETGCVTISLRAEEEEEEGGEVGEDIHRWEILVDMKTITTKLCFGNL